MKNLKQKYLTSIGLTKNEIIEYFDTIIPNPKCELNYNRDYEFLIAVMLSSQCTDKRVNLVCDKLFKKYTLNDLANIDLKVLELDIKSLGSYTKKAYYIRCISKAIINNNYVVPNNRDFLENLPGVGHKTASVVLSELFNDQNIAVDTHVLRVCKRIGICKYTDDVKECEKKVIKYFKDNNLNRVNHQLLLFGRYYCKAVNPKCENCPFSCRLL